MDHSDDMTVPDSCKHPEKTTFFFFCRCHEGEQVQALNSSLTYYWKEHHLFSSLPAFISSALRKSGKGFWIQKIIQGSDFADLHNSWTDLLLCLSTLITYLKPVHIHSTPPSGARLFVLSLKNRPRLLWLYCAPSYLIHTISLKLGHRPSL